MCGRLHSRCPRPRRSQAGAALVELALVLPLLIVLCLLVAEVGRAFHHYQVLTQSLRDAVRFLSVQDPSIATTEPARLLQARHMVVFGVPSPGVGHVPVVPGLSLANVPEGNIVWKWTDTTPRYRIVSVRVTGYGFRPLLTQAFGLQLADAQGVIAFGPIAAHMRAPE